MADGPFADRVTCVAHSPSIAISQRARELQAAGHDVIALTSGEPDFDTPAHVIDAAVAAMHRGETRYTTNSGTPQLKAAIIEKFARDNDLHYDTGQVMAGTGCKQMIFNALMATVGPGDEAIIPDPFWVSYPDVVRMAGGTPVFVTTAWADGAKLTPDALRAAITPRTRWLVLNTPCNPTGAVYSADELAALGAVLEPHGQIWVLTDDVYEHIRFDGRPFATMAQACPAMADRTLTINGVSKGYAMTGWRIGFCGGPAALIREMHKLQSHSTSNPCSISQAAAAAALTGPQDMLATFAAAYQARRDLAVAAVNRIDGMTCAVPEGAFYVYPDCSDLIGRRTPEGTTIATDYDLMEYILNRVGVATVHGGAFGRSPHIRISLAKSDAALREGLTRIAAAVGDLS